jgi:hypothetical protein
MAVDQPRDISIATDRGEFRVVTQRGAKGYATTVHRKLPDGSHTPVYEESAASDREAAATHERVIRELQTGRLP